MEASTLKINKFRVTVVDEANRNNYLTENDKEMDRRASEAVRAAIEKAKFLGQPIARYDSASKKAYLEYADGEKRYVWEKAYATRIVRKHKEELNIFPNKYWSKERIIRLLGVDMNNFMDSY